MIQAALCPDLFRLKRPLPWYLIAVTLYLCPFALFFKRPLQVLLLFQGMIMMIVGGNRSTIAAALVAIPVILILRRSTHALAIMIGVAAIGVLALRFSVAELGQGEISPLVRCFGIFDSKIDEASGGTASAKFRYDIWESGMEKIMENPVIGKGFGNLPKHLDPTASDVMTSTDFEVILAGGEAHNGFITAAYGFGIPFMLALTAGLFLRFFSQINMALKSDKHDPELRDLHAFLASMYPAFIVNIYLAFDMSVTGLWIYVAIGFILQHLPRSSSAPDSVPTAAQPAAPYLYPSRY
jgi:O-antigen ligase